MGNTALTVSNIKISSSRIPTAFSGFRIAQVSDLHNAESGKGNKKLLELLSESKPDIIVITGDFVDAGHTDIDVVLDFAKGAVNIAPVYYVTGNHEASLSQYDELKTGFETIGVIVLEDEAIQLKHEKGMITLIGISDPNFTLKGDIFGETPTMVSTKLNSLADDENMISESIIKQIHYLVLADKKEDRGVYRRIPVRIMGAQHELVQPYLIEPKMEQLLCDFAASTEHIVTKLARFHIEFEGIHPFIDAHVIIGTRLEKPSKINGFALLSPIFLSHAGWREDGAVHINTYYTESQMGLCA